LEKEKKTFIAYESATDLDCKGDRSNICYLLDRPLKELKMKSWHLRLLLYNIESDITRGEIPFKGESEEEYILNKSVIDNFMKGP
jgi:hypothetical protein